MHGAEGEQGFGKDGTAGGIGHAEHLAPHAGGVRERTEEVHDRCDAELAPDRRRVAHGRVIGRSEEEGDIRVRQHRGNPLRWHHERNPQCLEHVCRTRA